MRLLIREHVFSWTDRFSVTDEAGADRYLVEGEIFSFGRKLHVTRPNGNEAARVEQELFRFHPRYSVWMGGEHMADIVKKFSFFTPHYTVEGPGWDVEGDFWSHEYTVTKDGHPVVTVSKEWFTWGDCYALDISSDADEILALATVLAIDCIVEQR